MRLERAGDSIAKRIAGPDGARMGIAFAEMALELFDDAAWAWRALERALDADADVDEYVLLTKSADALARSPDAVESLARVVATCEKPFSNVGVAMLRLIGTIAAAMGDGPRSARAFVQAAEKDPDDDETIVRADAAVTANPEPAMVERLSKKVGVYRRSQALRAIAAKKNELGDPMGALSALERALEIAPEEARADIARELNDTLLEAGRGEEAVLREIAAPGLSAAQRAERWTALAATRKERADHEGATDALLQAASDSPSGDRTVLETDPSDSEAYVAIEALLVARASYDELTEHLARRAARLAEAGTEKETLRAIRLRRAAILEQRLGRLEDAAAELEQVLRETPNHASALRWLADLLERAGSPKRALAVLEQLAASATDAVQQESIGARRVRALLALGDLAAAQQALAPFVERRAVSAAVHEARVEIARVTQDPLELGNALEDLARSSADDARARSELLVEAAQAAARAGDTDVSLARVRDAARLAPDVASTQLFARGLEYRLRGAGTVDEATATIAELGRLGDDTSLAAEDLALRAFLLAEAEDVLEQGRGEILLRECLGAVGLQPLVALGLAERAFAEHRSTEAIRFFDAALRGSLLGLRRPGQVALAASSASERAADADSALRFLDEAAKDLETRDEALRRLAQFSFATCDMPRARGMLRGLADVLEGNDRAEVLAQLARALFESRIPGERIEADRTLREAIDVAPEDLGDRLREQLEGYRSRPPPASLNPPSSGNRSPSVTPPPLPTPPPGWAHSVETPPPSEPLRAVAAVAVVGQIPTAALPSAAAPAMVETPVRPSSLAATASPTSDADRATLEESRRSIGAGARDDGAKLLGDARRQGSLAATAELDRTLTADPAHATSLVKIRRQAVERRPGDLKRLAALRDAARVDKNPNYVRAIEHVLRAFDPQATPLAPPPLSAQQTQPGMLTLLTRPSREVAGEALGVVWEGASQLFIKPPTAFRMTGLERVAPGSMGTLSRLYEATLRLLDTPRISLFHRRGEGPLSLTVALLQNPAAILGGEAKEDGSDVRWLLGHALASVLPQNALAVGLPDDEARLVWAVLLGAFGPPGRVKMDRTHAPVAEGLWQALAPRSQRRLKELLGTLEPTPFELVVERANQSGRRVGMFLTGDFAHAARTVLSEYPALDEADLARPGGLERLCDALPSLADLFRLAVTPEYADARWHVPTPQSMRLPSTTGGIPPV
jgi:hypothetical protein